MTPESLALCKAIAKAEGWTGFFIRNVNGEKHLMGRRLSNAKRGLRGFSYVPAYLTDPAETVRMQAAIFSNHAVVKVGMLIKRLNFQHTIDEEEVMRATAETYLTTLLEKEKEHGREDGS